MKHIKHLVTTTLLIVLCFSSASFILAQNRATPQKIQGELSDIKDKRLIFVEVGNEQVKRQIEKVFTESNHFQVTQNLKDAELIYTAGIEVETRPRFGTVENQILQLLPSGERAGVTGQKNEAHFYETEYEYRRKTRAVVYYHEPRGKRVAVWSNEAVRINKSTESGPTLEISRKSGDELSLAKRFVKAVKRLK